jgi:hypothetical protein
MEVDDEFLVEVVDEHYDERQAGIHCWITSVDCEITAGPAVLRTNLELLTRSNNVVGVVGEVPWE